MGQKTRWSPAGPRNCHCTHTHIHQDKHGSEKTNRWADPDTYMHPVFNQDYSADNDGSCYEVAASSVV